VLVFSFFHPDTVGAEERKNSGKSAEV